MLKVAGNTETADITNLLLERKGKAGSNGEIVFCCPFHADSNPSCSYNPDKKVFICYSCGESGFVTKLIKRLTDSDTLVNPVFSPEATSKAWPTTSAKYAATCHKAIFTKWGKRGLDYLQLRGLTFADIINNNIGFDPSVDAITLPHYYKGKLFGIKMRMLSGDARYKATKPSAFRLYRYDHIHLSDTIIITEGEIDAVSAAGLSNLPCVAVSGKDNFKPDFVDDLVKVSKIYLMLDSDGSSDDSIEAIATMLGRHRCHLVDLSPYDVKDCNDLLVTYGKDVAKLKLDEAIANAKSLYKETALPIASMIDLAITSYQQHSAPALSTGYPLLDAMFGGFRPAELTVLTAYPGNGKTTLACSMALNIAKSGHRVGLALFESHSLSETIPLIAGLHHRYNPFEPRLSGEEYVQFLDGPPWQDLFIIDKFGATPTAELDEIFEDAKRKGVELLILDHLHFMTEGSFDVKNVVTNLQKITALCRQKTGIATLLIIQPTKPSQFNNKECPFTGKYMPYLDMFSIKGGTQVYENANTILLVQKDGKGVWMEAAKIRSPGVKAKPGDVKARLDFDKEQLTYEIYAYQEPKKSGGFNDEW